MKTPYDEERVFETGRGLTAINGAVALIAVLLICQLWVLWSALELVLDGVYQAALPAAIVSGILFAGTLALYQLIRRVESRRGRRWSDGAPRTNVRAW